MTSIERTAYPRYGRLVTARELIGMSPSVEEVAWGRAFDPHLDLPDATTVDQAA